MRPATENMCKRSRFGPHRRASLLANASICIQAVSSETSATIANQISFWAIHATAVRQTGVLRCAESVFAMGPATMSQFQGLQAPDDCVGHERVNRKPFRSVNRS